MIEIQKIEIIDENYEHCILFPKIKKEPGRLSRINTKLSPATLVAGIGTAYAGHILSSADLRNIGATTVLIAGIGIYDLVDGIRNKRQEKIVFEACRD